MSFTPIGENLPIDVFLRILNGLDVQLLVTDFDTGEILFANEKMNNSYDIDYNPVGKKCWKVYQNLDDRCDFCRVPELLQNPTVPVVWEEHNLINRRWYTNHESIIEWTDGRKVHLQQTVDVTTKMEAAEILRHHLEQQQLMSAMSRSFISTEDTGELIRDALRMTGEYIGVDRTLLLSVNKDLKVFRHEYDWYRAGFDNKMEQGQIFDDPLLFDAIMAHENRGYFHYSNVPVNSALRTLTGMGVKSLMVIPFTVNGETWIISMEDCSNNRDWNENDISLGKMISNTISGALARDVMEVQLKEAKESAEQGNRAKSEFLSRMSHEMRTPMNAIIGMTTIARNSDNAERVQYCLEKVDDASKHLLGVINDILDMSKIEAGKFVLSETDFPLEKVLERVTNVNNYRFEQKKQNFIIKVDKNVPCSIVADQQRLAQVITNLLSNASKFTPEEKKIRLFVRNLGMENDMYTLEFEVADEGIGLTEEQKSRLFHSFEQADGSITRRFGGTGLGLVISKNIVEMMGGSVVVHSVPNEGSRFIFTIKVKEGCASAAGELHGDISSRDLRLFVVDDAPEVLEYFSDIAESLGIACDTATNGEEALQMIAENCNYSILFIDWAMPGMDGIELTRQIRKCYGDNVIVIMISATDWATIADEALNAGVNRFMPKPLLPSHIVDCINECFGVQDSKNRVSAIQCAGNSGIFEGVRVLLAEDVEINREILSALLDNTGVTIDYSVNGREASDAFFANPHAYDMIIMDIHMPEMDGYEATRRIRACDITRAKTIPIVAMTANVFREDVERCLAAGMNDHVGKPVDVEEIISKIKRYQSHGFLVNYNN